MSTGTDTTAAARGQADWDRLASRARMRRRLITGALIALLVIVSLPIIMPYF